MLKYRLIFGPIMIAFLLGVLWLDQWAEQQWHANPGLVILLLLGLPGIRLASREIEHLLRAKGVPTDFRVLFVSGALGCVGVFASVQEPFDTGSPVMLLVGLAVVAMLIGLIARCWRRNTADTMLAGSSAAFAFVYLGLMPGALLAIRAEHSAWVLTATILITKSCDIGAYFTGRALGKRKLIPWLSPGKTWEGLAGGVALAAVVSLATLSPLENLVWSYALFTGVVLALVGQGGDLLVSMLKRDAEVKDSGSSIPGFGGVLDVFDSPLLVGPAAYWLLAMP